MTGRDAHDGARFAVRIFTPGYEVPFAGHPTVGTAFLLVALGMVECTPGQRSIIVTLDEKVGPVPVEVELEPRVHRPGHRAGCGPGPGAGHPDRSRDALGDGPGNDRAGP